LPLQVRREVSRAQVQAGLTVLTAQRGAAVSRDVPPGAHALPDGSD